MVILVLFIFSEPRTPADPCDRVKFILGGDEIDYTHSNGKHSVFTELEELKYDEHDHKWVSKVVYLTWGKGLPDTMQC